MSRNGVTYEEIALAAQQLSAEGKNPTVANVRIVTGTGSSGTIAQHLKTWKNKQSQTRLLCAKENLPEEIILTIKGLWERVITQAQEQVMIIKQELDETIAALEEKQEKLQTDNHLWQQKYSQLKQEKDILASENTVLIQINKQLDNEKTALSITNDKMLQQLQDKQDRIDELHRLTEQTQANLEHYREATREQRLLDEQRHQQTQLQLEQTIVQINQELMWVKQENLVIQQQNQQVNFEKNSLETQIDKLNAQHASISAQLTGSLNEIAQKTHSVQHWQEQHNALAIKWDEQNKLFLELQTQHALSLQEVTVIKTESKEIAEQNKLLAHEKWILGQEKAQLYGQLKQLQKMRGMKEGIQ